MVYIVETEIKTNKHMVALPIQWCAYASVDTAYDHALLVRKLAPNKYDIRIYKASSPKAKYRELVKTFN